MRTTVEQVQKLRRERLRGLTIEQAAMSAGMHRNTAAKYVRSGELPTASAERTWRTRADPFDGDWPKMAEMLVAAPGLEAKTLFEHLLELRPGVYEAGQLRTFQRRVKRWRATEGPEKEIFFPQAHRAGEAAQTDFSWATELGITILREPFDHMLCVTVLPYSLWQWATPCQSESMTSRWRRMASTTLGSTSTASNSSGPLQRGQSKGSTSKMRRIRRAQDARLFEGGGSMRSAGEAAGAPYAASAAAASSRARRAPRLRCE